MSDNEQIPGLGFWSRRSSVSHGSMPMEFPDFTRGKWQQRTVSAIATQV